ncbi:hypothetical protein F5B20DRAFT_591387 [Whalleya microplaca]|nr:hypothetical protein F5B20DRAFT_591387 [Whalleya microplaca]
MPDEGFGCRACHQLGVVCRIDGQILPECREAGLKKATFRPCEPCYRTGLRCDPKRPCDRCVLDGVVCDGQRFGCFNRGVPGDDYFGFYLWHGYGPTGVNDDNSVPNWRMPANYHTMYQDWVANGRPPYNGPDVINAQRQAPEAVAQFYQEIISIAQRMTINGQPVDMTNIINVLTQEMNEGLPPDRSQASRDLRLLIQQQIDSQPPNQTLLQAVQVDTSQAVNRLELQNLSYLNPGLEEEGQVAFIRNITQHPVERPVSPPPARPQYHIPYGTLDITLHHNDGVYPANHPELIQRDRLVRPLPEHPYPTGRSQLATIPLLRVHDDGKQWDTNQSCYSIRTDYGIIARCRGATTLGCEDTTHHGDKAPLCDKCDTESRDRFAPNIRASFPKSIRAYACHECTKNEDDLVGIFQNTGHSVWYDFASHPWNATGVEPAVDVSVQGLDGQRVGGWKGKPLEITGCACASKILNRRICSPHRLQYILNIDTAAQRMKDYVIGAFGRMVCFICQQRAGTNAYNFEGLEGGAGNELQCWTCLGCHHVVIARPSDQLTPAEVAESVLLGAPPHEEVVEQFNRLMAIEMHRANNQPEAPAPPVVAQAGNLAAVAEYAYNN